MRPSPISKTSVMAIMDPSILSMRPSSLSRKRSFTTSIVSSPSRSGGSLTVSINFAFLYIDHSLEQIHRVLYPLLGGVCSFPTNYRCFLAFKPLVHFKKVCDFLEVVTLDVFNVSIFCVLRIVERHAKHLVVCFPRIEHLKQCYWPSVNDAAGVG